MKIIMTGEQGLIGSYLKKRLEKEGHQILYTPDIRGERKNILNIDQIKVEEKIDMLIHLAAHCKINESIINPELAHTNNVEGTFKVIEFCRKNNIPKIVFFSSSRILSKEKNPYTASKIYGEELCKAYKSCYGINYVIIRPSTVYGPFWDKTERLMHKFIINALTGKDLIVYGNPETKTLDFTYINDFVDGVMLALQTENEEYDISGGEEYNIHKLAKFIIEKTQSKSKIIIQNEEIAQPQEVKLDITKIKKLGYNPKMGIEQGVIETINWYKNNLQ